MSNQAYHNKGFGVAFTWIIVLTMIVPLGGLMFIDATWKKGYQKPLVMDQEIINKVESKWETYWK